MRWMSRKALVVLAAGILPIITVLGSSPVATTQAATIHTGGTVYVGNDEEPDYLNPILAGEATSFDVLTQVFDGLDNYLPTGFPNNTGKWRWVPDLATNVPTPQNGGVTNGGKTVTFHLRKGVKFADGEPFTAADVVYTWKVWTDPKTNAYTTAGFKPQGSQGGITSITTPNPYTVVLHFNKPYAPYLTIFGDILPAQYLQKNCPDKCLDGKINTFTAFNDKPFGTGPMEVATWQHQNYVKLVKNPYYPKKGGWDGPAMRTSSIIYKDVPSTNTQILQMRTGALQYVDFIAANSALYQQFASVPGVTVSRTPGLEWEHLDFNLTNPLLSNLKIRQAILYGLNRQQMVQVTGGGKLFKVANGDQPPFSWAYDPKLPVVTQNIKKADSLLDAAGWKMGSNGYRYKNGQELTITCLTTSGNELRAENQQIIQQQMKKIGINWKTTYLPSTVLFSFNSNGPVFGTKPTFEVTEFAWVDGVDPDNSFIFSSKDFPPTGGNDMHWKNSIVDAAITNELSTLNQAQRKADLIKVEEQIAKDVPMIPLYYVDEIYATKNTLQGTSPSPLGYGMWNAQYWYLH